MSPRDAIHILILSPIYFRLTLSQRLQLVRDTVGRLTPAVSPSPAKGLFWSKRQQIRAAKVAAIKDIVLVKVRSPSLDQSLALSLISARVVCASTMLFLEKIQIKCSSLISFFLKLIFIFPVFPVALFLM